eukprot:TRINITY_DN16139_c0_g1_i1.p1 TRINITY_DN16139_c0_g1~~TRINITY_DN16139_c0_g1_i1.p1  ORF type:complete len:156 (+),score=23.97 TRINITY_DN16139_c0_g1_i1:49-516(+)
MKVALASVLLAVIGVCDAQGWVGDYYKLQIIKDAGQPKWTIHGLWPQWAAASSGYCRNVTFNETEVQSLLPQMKEDWPSDNGSDESFWTHEWEKHGSCADNMPEFQYFNTTLNLYTQYNHLCPTMGSDTECGICFVRDLSHRCECTLSGPGNCPH